MPDAPNTCKSVLSTPKLWTCSERAVNPQGMSFAVEPPYHDANPAAYSGRDPYFPQTLLPATRVRSSTALFLAPL
jgi:hypothetical protein